MTVFFVKEFKRANKCFKCNRDKLTSYSLCPDHLRQARDKFRVWAKERRAIGRCTNCNRLGRKTKLYHPARTMGQRELKCSIHREEMLKRTIVWHTAHPGRSRQEWQKRLQLVNAGFCVCSGHPKLPSGQRRCDACRTRHKFGGGSPQHLAALAQQATA
jgi:hypothetical protein